MMSFLFRPVSRLLDAAQRRFRRARPGSVLIMVVSLLVLLALIGTAAMSTARIDRQASRQHVVNVQIDMLAEGLKKMVIASIVNDLYAGNGIVSPGSDPSDTTPNPYTAWLGSAIPELPIFPANLPVFPANLPYLANPVSTAAPKDAVWTHISYPPFRTNGVWHFDPPNLNSNSSSFDLTLPKVLWRPTSITIGTTVYPALEPIFPKDGSSLGGPFLAADTDGDGIADSLLFKLPVSPIGGVTWYGASRVTDHNSRINVNTAGDPDGEFRAGVKVPAPGTTTIDLPVAGWFPASVGLYWSGAGNTNSGILDTTEYGLLQARRFIGAVPPASAPYTPAPSGWQTNPSRADYQFLTIGDAQWSQIGRRIDRPGSASLTGPYNKGSRPFSASDDVAMAHRFILTDVTFNSSVIESVFKRSTITNAPAAPYLASNVANWFTNFQYVPATTNSRSLLTAYNPVRNLVGRHASTIFTPAVPYTADGTYRSKTNVNTAQFEELYQTFFDVMVDDLNPSSTPFDDYAAWTDPTISIDPYYGQKFTTTAPYAPTINAHPVRMFRSPVRPPLEKIAAFPDNRLHPFQTLILRAAIAAINAKALREGVDDLPPVQQITLPAIPAIAAVPPNPAIPGSPAYQVNLYGLKRQPFITEIYLNNDPNFVATDPANPATKKQNATGFVAIELHNPYDTAMSLAGYHVRAIDRAKWPTLKLEALLLEDGTTPVELPAGLPTIPPGGYLILHNFQSASTDADTAQYAPSKIKETDLLPTCYVKGLGAIISKDSTKSFELVLTRTVGATEMPIDSFDTAGLKRLPNPPKLAGDPAVGPVEAWHYVRANDVTQKRRWEFVYPGRYDGTLPKGRHQGTDMEKWDPTLATPEPEPWIGTPPNPPIQLGLADDRNSRELDPATTPNCSFQIPLCTPGMPGPFKVSDPLVATPPPVKYAYPFGGFARVGDILHTPFIGAYTIATVGGGDFIEINAVTMDSVFAEDTDPYDDRDSATLAPVEDVGRFAPMPEELRRKTVFGTAQNNVGITAKIEDPGRFEPDGYFIGYDCVITDSNNTRVFRRVIDYKAKTASKPPEITVDSPFTTVAPGVPAGTTYRLEYKRYIWSKDLFDYFTTNASPADDYEPQAPLNFGATAPTPLKNVTDDRLANRLGVGSAAGTEDTVPVEGLININTASWKVLASLPLVMQADGKRVNLLETERLARAIVYFRDVDCTTDNSGIPWGPFKSIMELNNVPGFDTMGYASPMIKLGDPSTGSDPTTVVGDISPLNMSATGPHDGLRVNYEERFLNLTRISNLITLRSDTFTGYITVQGWRDAGTSAASMVAQRRLAFIVDRSRLSPTVNGPNKTPAVFTVPAP